MVNGQHGHSSIMKPFSSSFELKQLLFISIFIIYTFSSVCSSPLKFVPSISKKTFKDCSEKKRATVKDVILNGKPGSDCVLPRGSAATIEIDFISGEVAKSLKAVVHGIVAGIPVPFSIPQSDACQKSGLTCPLKKGTTYSYKTTIPVKSEYPKISLIVKWELQDDNNEDLICVVLPCTIA